MRRRPRDLSRRVARDRTNPLLNRLITVARVFSDRYDLEIVFSGNECYTDGRKIVLPSIAPDAPEEEQEIIHGHLDHEVAHIIESDWFDVHFLETGVTNLFGQTIEDLRVDYKIGQRWRGCWQNRMKTVRYMSLNYIFPGWNIIEAVHRLSLAVYYKSLNDSELLKAFPDQELLKKLSPLSAVLSLYKDFPSTKYSVALAVEIIKLLGLEPDEPYEEIPDFDAISKKVQDDVDFAMSRGGGVAGSDVCDVNSSNSVMLEEDDFSDIVEPADSGVSGSTSDETDGDSEKGGIEGEEKTKNEYKDDSDDSLGDLSDNEDADDGEKDLDELHEHIEDEYSVAPGDSPQTTQPWPLSIDSQREIVKQSVSVFEHFRTDESDFYCPYTTDGDFCEIMPDGEFSWFTSERGIAKQTCNVALRYLRMSLMGKKKSFWERGHHTGRIHPPDLHKLIIGKNPRVFKRRVTREAIKARVSLVIDVSGSMCGGRILAARRAAIVFGELCHSVGVPFEVCAFTTDSSMSRNRWSSVSEEEQKRYTRWGNLRFEIYKTFSEDWIRVGHRLQNMEAQEHNYDGEALLLAAKRLLASSCPGERLIMLKMSDGRPQQAIGPCQPHHQWFLRHVIEEVGKMGISLVGMGIQSEAIHEYYDDAVYVENPYDLSEVELKKMRELLQEKK